MTHTVTVIRNLYTVDFYFSDRQAQGIWIGRVGDGGVMEMTRIPEDQEAMIQEPTMRLNEENAALLMQEMWDQGFRPREAAPPTEGTVQALKGHIQFAEHVSRQAFKLLEG